MVQRYAPYDVMSQNRTLTLITVQHLTTLALQTHEMMSKIRDNPMYMVCNLLLLLHPELIPCHLNKDTNIISLRFTSYAELISHSITYHQNLARAFDIDAASLPELTTIELQLTQVHKCGWNSTEIASLPPLSRTLWILAQNQLLSYFSVREISTSMRRFVTHRTTSYTWYDLDDAIYFLQ